MALYEFQSEKRSTIFQGERLTPGCTFECDPEIAGEILSEIWPIERIDVPDEPGPEPEEQDTEFLATVAELLASGDYQDKREFVNEHGDFDNHVQDSDTLDAWLETTLRDASQ